MNLVVADSTRRGNADDSPGSVARHSRAHAVFIQPTSAMDVLLYESLAGRDSPRCSRVIEYVMECATMLWVLETKVNPAWGPSHHQPCKKPR
jgi:hypothetical protein